MNMFFLHFSGHELKAVSSPVVEALGRWIGLGRPRHRSTHSSAKHFHPETSTSSTLRGLLYVQKKSPKTDISEVFNFNPIWGKLEVKASVGNPMISKSSWPYQGKPMINKP